MKKKLKVSGFVLLIIMILLFIPEVKKETIDFIKAPNIWFLKVWENNMNCDISTSYHLLTLNYDYKIKDRVLYLRVYHSSMLNPSSGLRTKRVNINKGYNDFDKIYLEEKDNQELLWDIESGVKKMYPYEY